LTVNRTISMVSCAMLAPSVKVPSYG
jgi:hypothetical protein